MEVTRTCPPCCDCGVNKVLLLYCTVCRNEGCHDFPSRICTRPPTSRGKGRCMHHHRMLRSPAILQAGHFAFLVLVPSRTASGPAWSGGVVVRAPVRLVGSWCLGWDKGNASPVTSVCIYACEGRVGLCVCGGAACHNYTVSMYTWEGCKRQKDQTNYLLRLRRGRKQTVKDDWRRASPNTAGVHVHGIPPLGYCVCALK